MSTAKKEPQMPKAAQALDTKNFKFIEGTEIQKGKQGRNQKLIFKDLINGKLFKIHIEDDSYDSQSYANLCQWSDQAGWVMIMKLPLRSIIPGSIAYADNYAADHFTPAIERLQELAYRFN